MNYISAAIIVLTAVVGLSPEKSTVLEPSVISDSSVVSDYR